MQGCDQSSSCTTTSTRSTLDFVSEDPSSLAVVRYIKSTADEESECSIMGRNSQNRGCEQSSPKPTGRFGLNSVSGFLPSETEDSDRGAVYAL